MNRGLLSAVALALGASASLLVISGLHGSESERSLEPEGSRAADHESRGSSAGRRVHPTSLAAAEDFEPRDSERRAEIAADQSAPQSSLGSGVRPLGQRARRTAMSLEHHLERNGLERSALSDESMARVRAVLDAHRAELQNLQQAIVAERDRIADEKHLRGEVEYLVSGQARVMDAEDQAAIDAGAQVMSVMTGSGLHYEVKVFPDDSPLFAQLLSDERILVDLLHAEVDAALH